MIAAGTRCRGFTIQEVLTALAVTGLALSLAVPSFQNVVAEQRRATAVNSLVGTLQVARSSAMSRNQPVTICPSTAGDRCTDGPWEAGWIAFVDPGLHGVPGADSVLAWETGLPDNMRIRTAAFARSLSYRPNGQPVNHRGANETGTFWFCERGAEEALRGLWINASGLPRLVDRQINGPPFACGP